MIGKTIAAISDDGGYISWIPLITGLFPRLSIAFAGLPSWSW